MEKKDVTELEKDAVVDEAEEKQEEATEAKETAEEVEVEVVEEDNELTSLKKEKDELYERVLRLQAEFDNYKKRSLKEREADRKYKSMDLASELLPAIDNFERALQVEETEANKGLLDGISMVYRQLLDALKSQGVEVIEAVGKEFDPNIHQAVMQVEDESKESNVVVEELQKGYMIKDRVIRPAMVKVNK